ncbi:MAG: tRNA(Ile)-lysidine synthase [Gammaproteobacteria bacterium]|jgi:tRNA(Ile)-lysidine synthase
MSIDRLSETPPERILREVSRVISSLGAVPALSIAFSGGVDSSVLLEAMCRLSNQFEWLVLRALHVDHGLDECSSQWSAHCRDFCASRDVEFQSLCVQARAGRGQSPEEAARLARYGALRKMMQDGEALFVAHHADDQAETTLLQMLRGAGVLGSGGMRAVRRFPPGRMVRPLLNVRRSDIEACARAWNLKWVEDPSNQHSRYPRNRLRAEVLPLLEAIMPGAVRGLTRAAQLQREAADAVAQLARLDSVQCVGLEPGSLSRVTLSALPSARRRAVLRLWFQAYIRMPSQRRLVEIERQICSAARDSSPSIDAGGAQIEVHGDLVLLFRSPAPGVASGLSCLWSPPEGELQLPHGRLAAQPCIGKGLRAGGPVTVCVRRGGERCRPQGRAHSQTLKRLLQAQHIPSWRRHGLPLLYRAGELIAVADLWVCEGHAACTGEPGWQIHWLADHQPLRDGDVAHEL